MVDYPEGLHIETDSKGFILSSSLLDVDKIYTAANSWESAKCDFSRVSITRSVKVEKGVLFRPESSNITVVTARHEDAMNYFTGVFGRSVRIWTEHDDGNTYLGTGNIESTALDVGPGVDPQMTLNATDDVDRLTGFILYDWSASSEPTGTRIANVLPNNEGVQALRGMGRTMNSRPTDSPDKMTVLLEASDAQLARFWTDALGVVNIDLDPAPAGPYPTFTDSAAVAGIEYKSIAMSENTDNVITSAVARAKQDNTYTSIRTHSHAKLIRQEVYDIDLPLSTPALDDWTDDFPLFAGTEMTPSSVTFRVEDGAVMALAADIELLSLVDVLFRGNTYNVGVVTIKHDITPKDWFVTLGLIPGHLLRVIDEDQPSQPLDFTATPTAYNSIDLTWERPSYLGAMTGYTIRYATGSDAPATISDGSLLGTYDIDDVSATHGSLTKDTTYSYSIFATTGVTQSEPATATATTLEQTPTIVQSLSATVDGKDITLGWAAPATPGSYTTYVLRYAVGSTPPATPTSGSSGGTYAAGTTSHTTSSLDYDTTYSFSIWAKTPGGIYSPIASWSPITTDEGISDPITWSGYADWSQSYDGDNSKRTDSDGNEYCFFGYFSGTHGNQRSLIGFNVPAAVKNCYSITSITFKFTPAHTGTAGGAQLKIGTHTKTSEPSTFSGADTGLQSVSGAQEDEHLTITCNSDIRANFKAGAKGIAIGPAGSTALANYGYGYGSGASGSDRPWLEIVYRTIG